jgi:hypothetical protein
LRQLPRLRSLIVEGRGESFMATIPPFIPRSLKTLALRFVSADPLEALLRDLPSMLQASGAGLEVFEVGDMTKLSAEDGAAIARVLRLCSTTLRRVSLRHQNRHALDPAFASEVALGLVSCCEGLERLKVPWGVFKRLPPTCPAFKRLIHLTVWEEAEPIDVTSPVWDLVAGELLPALGEVTIEGLEGLSWGAEGKRRLIRALEAVAGTLRRLSLHDFKPGRPFDAVCYELGVAIGKMRRLSYLSLDVSEDGRSYQVIARGLAASGGCPLLFELHLGGFRRNMDFIAYEPSLIVPSVRNFAQGERPVGWRRWYGLCARADGLQAPPGGVLRGPGGGFAGQ